MATSGAATAHHPRTHLPLSTLSLQCSVWHKVTLTLCFPCPLPPLSPRPSGPFPVLILRWALIDEVGRYPAKILMVQAAVGSSPPSYNVQYPDRTDEMGLPDNRVRVVNANGSDVGGILFLDGATLTPSPTPPPTPPTPTHPPTHRQLSRAPLSSPGVPRFQSF
jgi:hypothetical protein